MYLENECEFSTYNFEVGNTEFALEAFNEYEREAGLCLERNLPLPAYDWVLKCCHTFNMLDARGAISATERRPTSCASAPSPRPAARAISPRLLARKTRIPRRARWPKWPIALDFLLEIGAEEIPRRR